jgi:hypothetical protein
MVVWPEGPVMTRAAALKKVIRARAAKTGERYTTARRHVLNELQQRSASLAATRCQSLRNRYRVCPGAAFRTQRPEKEPDMA